MNLQAACEFCARTLADASFWRWTLLATHGALQGALVLALQGTDGLAALTTRAAGKWMTAYRTKDEPLPVGRLDDFLELYAKVKDPEQMRRNQNARAFAPGEQHDRSVEWLHDARCEFLHFKPRTSWSVELGGLPRICLDALDVIDFLLWESGAVMFYEETDTARARAATAMLRAQLVSRGQPSLPGLFSD